MHNSTKEKIYLDVYEYLGGISQEEIAAVFDRTKQAFPAFREGMILSKEDKRYCVTALVVATFEMYSRKFYDEFLKEWSPNTTTEEADVDYAFNVLDEWSKTKDEWIKAIMSPPTMH